jgi:fructose-specific phosphotransferase system IIC component
MVKSNTMKKILTKMKYLWLKFKYTSFYQTYKEEMIVIPVLVLIFYFFNDYFITAYPQDAFYDFPSQVETIMYKILLFVVTLVVAHLALRITFPKVYQYLNKQIYHRFDQIENKEANQYAVAFILAFIMSAAIIFGGK